MPHYRKKPVVIEARKVAVDNIQSVAHWCKGQCVTSRAGEWIAPAEQYLLVHTLEGDMRANIGDYVLKGVQGEFYPCRADIFSATYELVQE